MRERSRRTVLGSIGLALTAGIAGCSDEGGDEGGGDEGGGDEEGGDGLEGGDDGERIEGSGTA